MKPNNQTWGGILFLFFGTYIIAFMLAVMLLHPFVNLGIDWILIGTTYGSYGCMLYAVYLLIRKLTAPKVTV
jgi:hypothetical protein